MKNLESPNLFENLYESGEKLMVINVGLNYKSMIWSDFFKSQNVIML